ncbi:MAG: hypothetical protein RsTaC01_0782 [Candidatus Paraimprobicoccus trichonymphae]|uniref:Uncharacterized protein n=1 Tax=Candidatus Paraimprobicoccus trichonymphae TaxID=3033793 RepID=A0AA48I351_9FIRM|nr:MAG: hypothetical protein RsTaC01_0782 [Candidatus Paraimprobicoccus trichonymphae]
MLIVRNPLDREEKDSRLHCMPDLAYEISEQNLKNIGGGDSTPACFTPVMAVSPGLTSVSLQGTAVASATSPVTISVATVTATALISIQVTEVITAIHGRPVDQNMRGYNDGCDVS